MRCGILSMVLLCSAVSYDALLAQDIVWEPTSMSGSTIHVRTLFASSDDILFAGTHTALFRSLDDGDSWQEVGPRGVNDLEELSSGALVAVGREGIHFYEDKGLTWTQVRPKPELDECGDILQYTHVVRDSAGVLYAGLIEETVTSGGCKNHHASRAHLCWHQ